MNQEECVKFLSEIPNNLGRTRNGRDVCNYPEYYPLPQFYNGIARVVRVIDGDTYEMAGFRQGESVHDMSRVCKLTVRLLGVDTPEKLGSNELEKQAGKAVSKLVNDFISGKVCTVVIVDNDKYAGRYLGRINVLNGLAIDNVVGNLAMWLIANKYALQYSGDKKVAFNKDNYAAELFI